MLEGLEFILNLFFRCAFILFPLGLWKAVEIIIWAFSHIKIV